LKVTDIYERTIDAIADKKSVIVSYGGSSSGKTVAAMQVLFTLALKFPDLQIFFFAQTIKKLENTLIEDFKRYVSGTAYFLKHYHKQDKFILIPKTNSKINFLSADDPDKYLGVRSDYLLFDEVNTYRYGSKIFKNLFARCRKTSILTFNPADKFWVTDYMAEDYCQVIHSTYKDNQFVPERTIKNLIDLGKKDENFKRVYLNGEWGALEGLIYKFKDNWDYCEKLPEKYDLKVFAIDFGYTNDPTTIIELRILDSAKEIYEKEHCYSAGLLNSDIIDKLKSIEGVKGSIIVADSAEPKSIAEIRKAGLDIYGAVKGADSIRAGIAKVKEYMVFVEKSSKNLIKEKMSYKYVQDKHSEKFTEVAEDKNNHLLDAERYGLTKFR
jgi:phage terminase large subunit